MSRVGGSADFLKNVFVFCGDVCSWRVNLAAKPEPSVPENCGALIRPAIPAGSSQTLLNPVSRYTRVHTGVAAHTQGFAL